MIITPRQINIEKKRVEDVALDPQLPPMFRAKAINLIGLSGDRAGLTVLDKCYRDPDAVVKSAAYHALKILTEDLTKDTEKIFSVSDAKMKVPDKDTRLMINAYEKAAAYARLPKLEPQVFGFLLAIKTIGFPEELSGFLTKSDVETLKRAGVPIIKKLKPGEEADIAKIIKEKLAKGDYGKAPFWS